MSSDCSARDSQIRFVCASARLGTALAASTFHPIVGPAKTGQHVRHVEEVDRFTELSLAEVMK
jgi:hypothetical protein